MTKTAIEILGYSRQARVTIAKATGPAAEKEGE